MMLAKHMAAVDKAGLVVVDALGTPLRPEWYSDHFRRLCTQAGVPRIRLHAIRHTLADALAATPEVAVIDAASLLGHTLAVFQSTYAKSRQDGINRAAATLGAKLNQAVAD